MRYSVQLILFLLLAANTVAQKSNEIIPKTSLKDSIQKFIAYNSISDELSYFLNGAKIDITKTFIDIHDIKSITVLSLTESKLIFGNLLKNRAMLIETKKKIILVSLTEYLKKKGIDSSQIASLRPAIDNINISNPDVILDSAIKINLVYVSDIHDSKYQSKKEDFRGVIIFTSQKWKRKNSS
jgi:hypothetical protein